MIDFFMNKQKNVIDNLYVILVLVLFVLILVFYPNKAYFHCDKFQNLCTLNRVSFAGKNYIRTAKLSSLSVPMYSSYYGRFRNDDVMYLIDNDKESDDNVFVQFSFRTLSDAKNTGAKFNNFLNSDDNEFNYTDKSQPKTYRNIILFLAFCFLLTLGNLYFNFSK